MTTETHVMEILERANPVPPGELVDAPIGATRYLETALEQRSEPMTIVDPTPTRATDPPRRRWPLIAVAASIVAILVASIALIVATRDDATVVDDPQPPVVPTVPDSRPEAVEPPTIAPPPDPAAAQAVVDEFFDAYNAGDTDSVMALLADGASVTDQYGKLDPDPSDTPTPRSEIENAVAWNHAQDEVWTDPKCEPATSQLPIGTSLSCQWETLDAMVQAIDGEPIPTNALIVVADGAIVGLHRAFTRPDFAALGVPFQTWMESSHPDVEGADCCAGDTRQESEQRGALRAEWARRWAAWLDEWECTQAASCAIPTEQWVAEYDARCTAVEPAGMPTPNVVADLLLLPRVADPLATAPRSLLDLDEGLIAPDISAEFVAELQRLRLDKMIELGIDERCHPVIE